MEPTLEELMRVAEPKLADEDIPLERLVAIAEGGPVPNAASAQTLREGARPDMMQNLREEVAIPYEGDTQKRLATLDAPNIAKAAVTGMKAMGAAGQAIESIQSTPYVDGIRRAKVALGMSKEDVPSQEDSLLQAAAGKRKTEYGDVFRELGLGFIAPPAGLLLAGASDPMMGAAKIGSGVVKEGAKVMSDTARSLKTFLATFGLNKNPAAAEYLADKGYLNLSKKTFAPGNEAAQDLANKMIKQWHELYKKPSKEAYDKLPAVWKSAPIPPTTSQAAMAKAARDTLAEDGNMLVRDDLLTLRVGDKTVTRTVGATPPKDKIVQTTSKVELPGKKITTGKGLTATTGNKKKADLIEKTSKFKNPDPDSDELGGYQPPETSKIATKETITHTPANPGRTTTAIKDRSLNDILKDAESGKPVTAEEWYSTAQVLKDLGLDQRGVRGRKIASAIEETLRRDVSELDEAMSKYNEAMTTKTQLEMLVGKWDENLRASADGAKKLYDYFEELGPSQRQAAVRGFEEAMIDKGKPDFTKAMKDTAAYHTNTPPYRPALTAMTILGGGAIGLNQLGVPPQAIAALGAYLAVESTPYLSAKGGHAVARAAAVAERMLQSPAGKFMAGQAVMRQLQERNNQ